MADPVTPTVMNVDGMPIVMVCAFTSTGATKRDTCSLPTYAAKFDVRIAHPIISMMLLHPTDTTADENYTPAKEMARGTVADSSGEWDISDLDTVGIYHETDAVGILVISYMPYGSQEA